MTNTNELVRIIKKTGFKMGYIAESLELSRSALWKKINNKSEFTQSQIYKLCNMLAISDKQAKDIFFHNR